MLGLEEKGPLQGLKIERTATYYVCMSNSLLLQLVLKLNHFEFVTFKIKDSSLIALQHFIIYSSF